MTEKKLNKVYIDIKVSIAYIAYSWTIDGLLIFYKQNFNNL